MCALVVVLLLMCSEVVSAQSEEALFREALRQEALSQESQPSSASLEVIPDTARVSVGDPIDATVQLRLPAGSSPIDVVPAPVESLPEGVRLVSADNLVRLEDGSFQGRLRLVLFRPGTRSIPALEIRYRGTPAVAARAVSTPVPIEVVAVLPPGQQTLKDIKDLERLPTGPNLVPWLVLLAALLLVAYLLHRYRRRRRTAAPIPVLRRSTAPRSAYERALERLREIEEAGWPARGRMAEHYEQIANVVRHYLEEAEGLHALERTTGELVWALPPALSEGGLRDDLRELLDEADLVKFARLYPTQAAAASNLTGARSLLERWHAAGLARAAMVAAIPVDESGESIDTPESGERRDAPTAVSAPPGSA
jgi:hypothetical protein